MTPQQYEHLTELFHAALKIVPKNRAAFLDQVSAGDDDLRRELESLLATDEQRAAYTDVPPDDIAAGLYQAQHDGGAAGVTTLAPNTRLDHYEIRSLLGKGGMGEVYLAEDIRLHRKVALKILPATVASNRDRMRRFEQEATAAAALNHPHIAHIYEIGETEGTHFIALEHIDGVTLRHKIHRDQAPLQKLLKYLTQVAEGLTKAHTAGIVHRDLKPDNIMITHDDYAKILDFGLAKLIEPQRFGPTPDASNEVNRVNMVQHSLTGVVMGTPGYMSPEQARGKVELIDHRSDIFSFGCVLFEAVTAQKPFVDESVSKSIYKVLYAATPLIKDFNPSAPPDLQRVIRRCLKKDPDERYQTIKDVALELKEVLQEMTGSAAIDALDPSSKAAETQGRQTTKQPTTLRSSAAFLALQLKGHKRSAAIALAGLLIVAAGLAYFSYHKRTPALTEQDTILIADFVNTTGDTDLDDTLKTALTVQLGQSPFLNIVSDERVRETLRYMGRSPDERVTNQMAREICERQGIKAMLTGSITRLGSHYIISLEALNAHDGESVAREQVEAESKELILRTLGGATTKLRERLGESLSSLQKFDAPIDQATTSSLEALKAFTLGNDEHLPDFESIPFFKRAVELDDKFALAYAKLGVVYANTGQYDLAAKFAAKAFELRERASERERLYISSYYFRFVTKEIDKVIEVEELWKQTYPRDSYPHGILAAVNVEIGQYEKAIQEAREAIRLNPNDSAAYVNLGWSLASIGRFEEARAIFEDAVANRVDSPTIRSNVYLLAFVQGDQELMQQQLDWASGKPMEEYFLCDQGHELAFSGQMRKSRDLFRRSIAVRGGKETSARAEHALWIAVAGDCQQAKKEAADAFANELGTWPRLVNAVALGLCGERNQAQFIAAELISQHPKRTIVNAVFVPTIRAAVETYHGNPAQAIQLLQAAGPFERAYALTIYVRGLAYLRQHAGADAATEFKKIIEKKMEAYNPLYSVAYVGLARAYVLQGDKQRARKSYEDFFALWKNADPDLPVLIEAKREYEKLK